MFKVNTWVKVAFIMALLLAATSNVWAYQIPEDFTRVKYFFVFGPEGNPLYGKEDSSQTVYIDVPQDSMSQVMISVYDPDVGDFKDWKSSPTNKWDTKTEFSVSGSKLLDKKTFGQGEYDRDYYQFGPYDKTAGEKVGEFYRFKLEAKGLEGDDANLFKVMISPEDAESFSYDITFRLLGDRGEEMYFFPEIPAGTEEIIVENWDLDADGGHSVLYGPVKMKQYHINDSLSGQWKQTVVPLEITEGGRLKYQVTKEIQPQAHAGLKIKDAKGNLLPIYFRRGEPAAVIVHMPEPAAPDLKCNCYTFDATKSYDPDNQQLDFLWDFGDGTTSKDPVVKHCYEKGGEYKVTLTVTDNSGLQCDTATTSQMVKVNTAPMADFIAPELVCVDETVKLDASSSKDDTSKNLSYYWDLGDGSKAEGIKVNKTYAKGGTYKIRLMVDDNENTACSSDSIEKIVKVNTAPVAEAGNDIERCLNINEEYKVNLSAGGSYDADRDELTYSWNLGDGSTANGRNITHVYSKGGIYKVRLTVNDGTGSKCSVDSDTLTINLNKSPIADAGEDISTCVGSKVTLDGSGSQGEGKLSYAWDLGDGNTATGTEVTHSYNKGGTYLIALTVDDGKGTKCSTAVDSKRVFVNSKPNASLAQAAATCIGKTVVLDASASSDPDGNSLSYAWDFGDGTTAQGGSRQSHVYDKGGNYKVIVTVDDGRGSACSVDSAAIRVKVNAPPVADAGPNLACCVGKTTTFDGSKSYDPDGDSLSYSWNFGDGSTGSGAKVTHVYKERGKYTVTLAVNDNSGTDCSIDTDSFEAVVNETPVPIIRVK